MSDDETVSQFMAVTGCSEASQATSYLEMSGGNLETAVGLYMEHQGGGGGAAASAGAAAGMEDTIRAPDATQRMQLMDDRGGGGGIGMGMSPSAGSMLMALQNMDPSLRMMHEMMENELQMQTQSAFAERRALRSARDAVNNAAAAEMKDNGHDDGGGGGDDDDFQYDYDDADNDDNMDEGSNTENNDDDDDDEVQVVHEPPRLSGLFAPPPYRFTTGGFQNARTTAKDAKRWLLVNIQRDSEFSSHALNRDVWSDELIENLVSEGFIFWQVMDGTTEGQTYSQRYQVHDFPHMSIIDPRTGRLMWRKEGWTQEKPMTAETLAQYLMDFCSSNTMDRPPQAPRAAAAASTTARPKRPIEAMTEEEQLQEAMRVSVAESGNNNNNDAGSGNDDDEVQVVEDSKPAAAEAATEPEVAAPPSLLTELLEVQVEDEPAAGARIQLRMPDGKRVVRKFATNASVKVVYAFVAQLNDKAGTGSQEFVLKAGFPPKDLLDDIDKTIEECNLSGGAIAIRWKE